MCPEVLSTPTHALTLHHHTIKLFAYTVWRSSPCFFRSWSALSCNFLFFGTVVVLAYVRRVFSAMAGFSFFGRSVAWPRRGELFLPYDACARSGGYIFIYILFWAWNAILASNRCVFIGWTRLILQFLFFCRGVGGAGVARILAGIAEVMR